MLSFPPGIQVFMAIEPVDMRKSFDGLNAAVQSVFERNVLDGHLFLFLNRRRDRIKLMAWDGDGCFIWYKKLESEAPPILLFPGIGGAAHNLGRWRVAAAGMDAISPRIGPWRRPMSREITLPIPRRA